MDQKFSDLIGVPIGNQINIMNKFRSSKIICLYAIELSFNFIQL